MDEAAELTSGECKYYLQQSDNFYESWIKPRIKDRCNFSWRSVSPAVRLFGLVEDQFSTGQLKITDSLGLKERLAKSLETTTQEQELFAEAIGTNRDLLVHGREAEEQMSKTIALHILNRVMRARDRIIKNNLSSESSDSRDQGFTRPRILVLLPMRNMAYRFVAEDLEPLWKAIGGQIDGFSRFQSEYGPVDEDGNIVEIEEPKNSHNPNDLFTHYSQLFAGNADDCFRIGIKITRKSMKLFADFYSADIILASPLGLKLLFDGCKVGGKSKKINTNKKRETKKAKIIGGDGKKEEEGGSFDFLSSIDTLMIGHAEVMAMQNWDHLIAVLGYLNKVPKDPRECCDFSRILSVHLDGNGRSMRQSLIFTRHLFPELMAVVAEDSGIFANAFGFMQIDWSKLTNQPSSPCAINALPKTVKLEFLPIQSASLAQHADDRMTFFFDQILPRYRNQTHVAIFVSGYFDFCQLKARLTAARLPFACLSEYETADQITGSRARFYNGHVQYLLVTERFHFYKRYPMIRGVRQLVFYSVPEWSEYLVHWIGYLTAELQDKKKPAITVPILYTAFDYLKLERIVGTEKISKLI